MKKLILEAERKFKSNLRKCFDLGGFSFWVQSNIWDRENENKGSYKDDSGNTTFGKRTEFE